MPVLDACIQLSAKLSAHSTGEDIADETVLALMACLRKKVRWHTYTPVCLAASFADLPHKAQALCHMVALESSTWGSLSTQLHEFISMTSDMGTELGIADFRCNLMDIKPTWFSFMESDGISAVPMATEPDFDHDDMSIEPGQGAQGSGATAALAPLLQNAMPIAGLQHIINNLNGETHTCLQHWPEMWQSLKNIEALMVAKYRRRHFIWTCVAPNAMPGHKEKLERWQETLYQNRWHEVLSFCRALQKTLPLLRLYWDEQRYCHSRGEEKGKEFSPAQLTQTLQSRLFSSYLNMLITLDTATEKLASWSEGCPCHDSFFAKQGFSLYRRQAWLQKHSAGHRMLQLAFSSVTKLDPSQVLLH